MMSLALRINDFLSGLFLGVGIRLVDFKSSSAGCGRTSRCASCWPTRSRPIAAGCGTSRPTKARQGPLPPRHGRAGRGLSGGGAPARHLHEDNPTRTRTGPVLVRRNRIRRRWRLMKARITITLKHGVLDPQGKAIEARCTRSASPASATSARASISSSRWPRATRPRRGPRSSACASSCSPTPSSRITPIEPGGLEERTLRRPEMPD